jgi:hypothetical protein
MGEGWLALFAGAVSFADAVSVSFADAVSVSFADADSVSLSASVADARSLIWGFETDSSCPRRTGQKGRLRTALLTPAAFDLSRRLMRLRQRTRSGFSLMAEPRFDGPSAACDSDG